MTFTNLKWADAAKTQIFGLRDGAGVCIPADPANPDFAALDLAAVAAYVAPSAPVPQQVTFAQLVTALVAQSLITEVEGEAWLQGSALPAAVMEVVNVLPTAEQFPAKARLYRMQVAERSDPLVAALAANKGMTSAQVDQFFMTAAAL